MTYLKGLDVSTYQTLADWSPVGLAFLIARASIGTTKDSMYDKHIAKAKAAGLVTGAYHFNLDDAASTPEQQADLFVQAAGDVDLLFLDVEGARAFEPAESQRFIARVQSKGKRIGLYMSLSPFRDDGQDYNWIAFWSATPPTKHWEFWQYGPGEVSPDGGKVDGNRFYGTLEQLHALSNKENPMAGLSVSLPPQSPAVAGTVTIPKGTVALRLSEKGVTYTVPIAVTRPAYPVNLTAPQSGAGFLVDLNGDVAHFVRAEAVTFTPAPTGYSQAQFDAAKQAAHNAGFLEAKGKAGTAVAGI